MGISGLMRIMRSVHWLALALVVSASAETEQAHHPYVNDEVALPVVINMVQMKAGVGATTTPPASTNDVVVNGVMMVNGNVHSAKSLMADKTIRATGSISTDDKVAAKVAVNSAGTMTAKGTITSQTELASTGILSVEGVATIMLQSSGGVYTKGNINGDQRIVAKGDIHTDKMLTAKEAIVTPGNVFAEGTVKATKDVRAGAFVYGNGISADDKGVTSKGLIHGLGDIKADTLVVGVKGVNSNMDVTADNNVVAKKEAQSQTLKVTKDAKVMGNMEVAGMATFGTATIKGKLYVGDRAITDIVTSMETDMSKMRTEMAETKESLRQAMMLLEKMAA